MPLSAKTVRDRTVRMAAVTNCLKSKVLNINTISIETDWYQSMKCANKNFVSLLKKQISHDVFSFHCIPHQEAHCSQTFPKEMTVVMDLVVQIINKVKARQLYHWQFCELLKEVNCEYFDFLLHNKVRWLSRGAVLM